MTPSTTSHAKLRYVIYNEPPAFHFWKGEPQTGGFSIPYFEFIESTLQSAKGDEGLDHQRCLETGAGLSTLFFLSLGLQVSSFSLPDVIDKIRLFLGSGEFAGYSSRWTPHGGRSELLLGPHAIHHADAYDCCLIDGSHSVHSVFNDFMYCHEVLRVGGVLFVDDTHFPGPSLLGQMLDQLDSYVDIGRHRKLRAFKKANRRKTFDNMLGLTFKYPES